MLRTHGDHVLTGLPSAEPERQGETWLGPDRVCGFKLSNLVLGPSMHALAISYYNSADYLRMKANSQRVRKNVIERFCREADANGQRNGDKRAALLQREHIVRLKS